MIPYLCQDAYAPTTADGEGHGSAKEGTSREGGLMTRAAIYRRMSKGKDNDD